MTKLPVLPRMQDRLISLRSLGTDLEIMDALERLVMDGRMREVWEDLDSGPGRDIAEKFLAECNLFMTIWQITPRIPRKARRNRLSKIADQAEAMADSLDAYDAEIAFHGTSLKLQRLMDYEGSGITPRQMQSKELITDILRKLALNLRTTHTSALEPDLETILPTKPREDTAQRTFLAKSLTRFLIAHGRGPSPTNVSYAISALFECVLDASDIGQLTKKIRARKWPHAPDARPDEWLESSFDRDEIWMADLYDYPEDC